MAAEVKKEIQLEIAHVLFTDIVGYSKLPINQQRALVERLNEIVRGTDEFHIAETAGGVVRNPNRGGLTAGFFYNPRNAGGRGVGIKRGAQKKPGIQLRKW